MNVEYIKQQLMKTQQLEQITESDYLSTGCTLLDLACSDTIKGGFIKGKYYFLVGDSASGKTFLSLTCLAEASNNKNFDNYRFIYDNSEGGALMSIEKFFGAKVVKRLEAPNVDKNNMPIYSSSIEEFYYNVDDALQEDRPFIYVLDSMDSLTSDAEIEKFEETKAAYEKGKQVSGSYGDGKAKKNSANLRRLMGPLKESGSILIILNQTRDNLGFGFEKKSRAGGHSLRFYACLEMWSSVKGKITKTYKNKKRQIGIKCCIQLKKNRLTGKERTIEVPIYYSYGFDDIGCCVDYLIEEEVWVIKKNTIHADDFGVKYSRDKLINHIEENSLENDLKMIVQETWKSIEDACALKRKKRY